MDNLTLTLEGNLLSRVDDAAAATAYNGGFEFRDGARQPEEYVYDENGNLVKDLNRNILFIGYNSLNLPETVRFVDGSTISYVYTYDGTKVRAVHKVNGVTTTTDYRGSTVYENGVAKLILTDDGYLSLPDKKFHYYLKDHQGNNRVVLGESGEVEEVNHYYPFGGMFAGTESVQPYKYNGKEFDGSCGLNWYDYGARRYDAALGRFTTVDPMAEKRIFLSPYVYGSNNPINRIDADGMLDDWVEDRNKRIYWDPNAVSQASTKAGETYLGKTVVDFSGSRQERLGTRNGESGYINGEGAVTADVTVYGSGGPDDVSHFTGYTMSSDAEAYGAIDEGIYDGNYDVNGKRGGLTSHWVLNHRGPIRALDGQTNPNAPSQVSANGEGYKDGIFIHSTNRNGFAGVKDGKAISAGCLLISPKDWGDFNSSMSGVQDFKVRVHRQGMVRTPLQGVTGIVSGIYVNTVQDIY